MLDKEDKVKIKRKQMAIIKKFRITSDKKERTKIQLNNISIAISKRQILEYNTYKIRESEI